MIEIKILKKESLEDFSADIIADGSKLDTGNVNAYVAAMAASLFVRAVKDSDDEYLKRNAEILRTYFIHLVDDDTKARNSLAKTRKEGDPLKIEAAIHVACSVNEEIVNMCRQMLELMTKAEPSQYIRQAAYIAMGAVRSAIDWLLEIVSECSDDTYRFVVKRENEVFLKECEDLCQSIL